MNILTQAQAVAYVARLDDGEVIHYHRGFFTQYQDGKPVKESFNPDGATVRTTNGIWGVWHETVDGETFIYGEC